MIIYKDYQIKPDKKYPSTYVCVTDGKGGKIPDVLSGLFTSSGLVKKTIDKYLEDKNAKANSKG